MSQAAAAIAHELGNHIDDLVDDGPFVPETADGESLGTSVLDTMSTDSDLSFLVLLADGRLVRVTCEEVAK